jgi:hypothetical protein
MKKLTLFILALLYNGVLSAQELNATVEAQFEGLPVINKENLAQFAANLQTYLNNTKYSSDNLRPEDRIPCTIKIYINSASDDVTYSAQLVIVAQRKIYRSTEFTPILRVSDPSWNFVYERNQALYFTPNVFNSVTSLLDYYALVMIGLETDTWSPLAGTQFFTRANDIVNLSLSSSFSKGWESASGNYNRRDFVENALNEKYRTIREGFADYHYAIDLISQKNVPAPKKELNTQKALNKIVAFINGMDQIKAQIDIRSVYVKCFFDAKFAEITDKLRALPDKAIFKTLKTIDPPHAAKYDEAMKN